MSRAALALASVAGVAALVHTVVPPVLAAFAQATALLG